MITHPGAKLFVIDGEALRVLESWIKPFTVYYVYQRASVAGEPWLEVGLSSTEGPMGWINGTKTSDWNQALTLVFTDRTGRKPALFSKDLKSLQSVAGSSTPRTETSQLVSQFSAIRNDDPYSSTGMNAAEIANLAAGKGIKIFALHLKTPADFFLL